MTERKSGMYGQMPKIIIGKYTIAEMSNETECNSIWIEDTEIGEGAEFQKEEVFAFLDKFYKDNF